MPAHVAYLKGDTDPVDAADPWEEVGVPTIATSVKGLTLSSTGTVGYGRHGLPTDLTTMAPRPGDRMELQAKFTGSVAVPGWPGGTPPEPTLAQDTLPTIADEGGALIMDADWNWQTTSFIAVYGQIEDSSVPISGLTGFAFGHDGSNILEGGVFLCFPTPTTVGIAYRPSLGVTTLITHTLSSPWAGRRAGWWARVTPTSIRIGEGPESDGDYTDHAVAAQAGSRARPPSLFGSARTPYGGTTWSSCTPIYLARSVTTEEVDAWMAGDMTSLIDSGVSSGEVFLWCDASTPIGMPITAGDEGTLLNTYGGASWSRTGFTANDPFAGSLIDGSLVAAAGSDASPHVMQVDDGDRVLGVAIGDALELIDPADGSIVASIDPAYGWAIETSIRLVKRESTSWDLYLDGRLAYRLPYKGAPISTRSGPWYQFGTVSAGGTSVARWGEVESATNASVAPHWKVARARLSMPGPIQEHWSPRWDALIRAVVGLQHTAADAMQETYESLTAGLLWSDSASFSGALDLDDESDAWTKDGVNAATMMEIRRDRLRIIQSVNPVAAKYTFAAPQTPDETVIHVRATVLLDRVTTEDPRGRAGPVLTLANGHRIIRAALLRSRDNPDSYQWVLSDGPLTGALGNLGARAHVDPFDAHIVDLYVVERKAVVLAIDGWLLDVQPYNTFTTATSEFYATVGRDGANDPEAIRAVVDYEDITVRLGYADSRYRPWLQQRVSERLIFAGGCESNALLQVLSNHSRDLMRMRGTWDGILNEARRLACDSNVQLVRDLTPADWYLEITWPEETPVFIEANGFVQDVFLEHSDNAPNFTADELEALFATYILPLSTVEAQFSAPRYTLLTTATTTATTTTFDVADPDRFAAGDAVTLRELDTGTVLTVEFDAAKGLTATDLRNFAEGTAAGSHGTFGDDGRVVNGTDAPFYYTALIEHVATSPGWTQSDAPTIAAGFTVHMRVQWVAGGSDAILCATADRDPNGFALARISNNLRASIWSAAGQEKTVSLAGLTAGTWYSVAVVADGTDLLLYVDGVEVAALVHGITLANPASGGTVWLDDGGTATWASDARDCWLFERALTPSEVAALAAGERIDDPRDFYDDTLFACFAAEGWSALQATHEELPHTIAAPDFMELSAYDNAMWASWRLRTDGAGDSSRPGGIVGQVELPALDADKQNDVGSGNTITVEGFNATVNCTATAWGIDNAGDPARETFLIVAGAAVVGATLWSEVHGLTIDTVQTAAVRAFDTTTTDQLYVVSAASLASGVYRFPSYLLCGPSTVRLVSDGATTDNVVVFGVAEGAAYQGETVALTGTTQTESSDSYDLVDVISASHLPTGQTLTANVLGMDPTGVIELVSDDAADTMDAYVLTLDASLEAQLEVITLDGTTPVNGSLTARRLLGVYLAAAGAGTLTVTTTGGQIAVHHGTLDLAAGGRMLGGADYSFANVGAPSLRLSQPQSTVRYVGMLGLIDGAYKLAVVALDGTEWIDVGTDFDRVLAVATGNVPHTKWILAEGRAWRGPTPRESAQLLNNDVWRWSAGGSVTAPDIAVDNVDRIEATLGAIDLAGSYSVREDTTITTISGSGSVITPPLLETFGIGARMRARE